MKKLMEHQEIGVSLMVQHAIGFANHSDPGTGKTLMAISAADRIGVDKVLVVCPRTLKINWSIEWKDGVKQEWNIVVISGTKARRNKQIEQACKSNQATLLITHYDTLEKDLPQLIKFKPDLIIGDELHLIKNHRSHRAKALKKIPTKYKFGLTGTPQTNSPLDHYSQFDWLRPGYLGVNFYVFRAIYADVYTGGGYPLIKSYRRIDELKAKIAKYAYRARKDECLDLPDKMFQTILIDLEPSARKIYDTLAEEFIADVFHDGEQHEVLADTVLVRLLRFQQLTSGFIGIEGPPKTVKPIGDEKLEALIELAETMDREKIVVWTKFNYDMQRVSAALAETGRKVHRIAGDVSEEDRNKAVQEFQQDNNRNDAIVCNIQVGGTGLTLTAARYAIYYSRNFSLGDDIQSQDRIHRIGQTRKVTYYDLVCRNTIDEHIIKLLRKKKELAARINGDDVRRILRGES